MTKAITSRSGRPNSAPHARTRPSVSFDNTEHARRFDQVRAVAGDIRVESIHTPRRPCSRRGKSPRNRHDRNGSVVARRGDDIGSDCSTCNGVLLEPRSFRRNRGRANFGLTTFSGTSPCAARSIDQPLQRPWRASTSEVEADQSGGEDATFSRPSHRSSAGGGSISKTSMPTAPAIVRDAEPPPAPSGRRPRRGHVPIRYADRFIR